jgi:membrane-associated phospholipid phosphatase
VLKRSENKDSIHTFAFYVSVLLNPTTLGVIAVAVFSVMFGSSRNDTLILFAISFLFCVLLPFLYLVYLKSRNAVESLDVPIRDQRTVPYLLASVSYAVGLALLVWYDAPWPIVALLVCYLGNTLFVVMVNFFWKISAHTMGVGAVVTGFGIAVSPLYFIGVLLLPLVSWSRIKLDMHSRGQVIAGSILSVILTAVQFEMIHRLYQ